MRGNEFQVASSKALNLAANSQCSAYDCEFVALAKELDIPLATTDQEVLKDFPEIAVSLGDIAQ